MQDMNALNLDQIRAANARLADPRLLPELRFWVANQGVALNVVGNYKPILRDMLAREESEAAR